MARRGPLSDLYRHYKRANRAEERSSGGQYGELSPGVRMVVSVAGTKYRGSPGTTLQGCILLLPAERQTAIQQFDHSTAQTASAIEERLDQARRKKRQLHDAPDVTRSEALGPTQLMIRGDFCPLETTEPFVGPADCLH